MPPQDASAAPDSMADVRCSNDGRDSTSSSTSSRDSSGSHAADTDTT